MHRYECETAFFKWKIAITMMMMMTMMKFYENETLQHTEVSLKTFTFTKVSSRLLESSCTT